MNQELLNMFQDPAKHEQLAEMLAGLSAPPQLPDTMLQGTAPGGPDFGTMLDPSAMVAQGPGQQIPTGPMPAPKPAPGVQWWKQPTEPVQPAAAPMSAPNMTPPSAGFNPNKDREWRDDVQFMPDQEFMAKWGRPKPGGQ
jgi:hypothetical protein